MKEIVQYWTASAAGYDKVVRSQFRSRRTVRMWQALLREGLGDAPGQRVLDAGTGPGFLAAQLAAMGHRPTAVDASPGMVEAAARNFRAAGHEIEVYEGDASDLRREADASYDAVVSRDVVWTLPDPAGAYREWHRILKPGGRLIVFDGNYLYREQRGLAHQLWYALAWTLILLTERRIRRRTGGQPELRDLPFAKVLRPEADEQALRQAGFVLDIVRRNYIPGYKRSLHYWKYGCQTGIRFMIIARKGD